MLKKTFMLTCVDCGTQFEAKCTNAKRCKACAAARLKEKHRISSQKYREGLEKDYNTPRKQKTMVCEACGVETVQNSANQKYCPTCSVDAMYRRMSERRKRLEAEARGEITIAHIGDTIKCVDCGTEMKKMNARHIRCAVCREKHRLEKNREEWQRRKEEREAKKREKATAPKRKTLSDIVAEARSLGLSYGQYTTLLNTGTLSQYCKTHGISLKGA